MSKEIHGLVNTDICIEVRQNYGSLEKLMEARVLRALENHIPDSKATIKYLTLCKQITSAFVQENLTPIERVYMIWNALYFLKCWRNWIKNSKNRYTLTENFISSTFCQPTVRKYFSPNAFYGNC